MDRLAPRETSSVASRARAAALRSKKLFESENVGVIARRRAGAATSLGFRRGDAVVSRESVDVADASRAMSLLESTVARAEAKVAGLRARDASREDVAAVEEALEALDLVASCAREESKSQARARVRERARARELRDELTREKRHRARAEAEARAARCELACVKATVRVSDARVGDDDACVVVADDVDAVARTSSSSTSSDDDDVAGREVESTREETPSEIAVDARRAVADDGHRDACSSGRDRLVPETGDDDEIRFYADVAEDLDAETTHRNATLIAFDLARVSSSTTTRMTSNDIKRHTSTYFYKRHGSRALGELHRKMFFNALARRRAASEWAQVFARVLEDVDAFEFAHAMRLIRHVRFVLVESPDLDAAPIMSVDEGARALAFLLAPLSGKSSAAATKEFESIRRRATHVNGTSHISFAAVLERGIDAVQRAKASVRSALAETFARRHPDGTLAHHSTLVKTLVDAVATVDVAAVSAIANDTDGVDRIAHEIASADDFVTLERFVDGAFGELTAMTLSRADAPDTEPAMRSARFKLKPNAMTIDVMGSLALVTRAWDFASRVIDRRLAAWTSRDDVRTTKTTTTNNNNAHRPHGAFPIPPVRTADVTKRALVRRHVDRLLKLRSTCDFALRAASSLSRRVDASDDIARAWRTYAAVVCAFETARRVVGVVDPTLAAW